MKQYLLIGLIGLAGSANAAVPDRDWPSVVVTSVLDVPMRDTAITRGPDGTYYLTGTLGQPVVGRAALSPPQPANDGALGTARPTGRLLTLRAVDLLELK